MRVLNIKGDIIIYGFKCSIIGPTSSLDTCYVCGYSDDTVSRLRDVMPQLTLYICIPCTIIYRIMRPCVDELLLAIKRRSRRIIKKELTPHMYDTVSNIVLNYL
jgi:hypothetical protein